jgi:hypothetical protein
VEQSDKIAGIPEPTPAELSGRWEGYLDAPVAGDYKFSVFAQNEGKVWIDDKLIITHVGHRSQESPQATVKLTAGRHSLKAEMRFWQEAPGMRLFWEGPNMQKQVVSALGVAPVPETVLAASKALSLLAAQPVTTNTPAPSLEAALAAQRSVRALGAAAAPLLLQVIRHGEEPAAAEALGILLELPAEARGPVVASALVARAEKVVSPAFRLALARALREVSPAIAEAECKRMLAALNGGAGMEKGLAFAGLCGVLDRPSGGKAEASPRRPSLSKGPAIHQPRTNPSRASSASARRRLPRLRSTPASRQRASARTSGCARGSSATAW